MSYLNPEFKPETVVVQVSLITPDGYWAGNKDETVVAHTKLGALMTETDVHTPT